MLLPMLFAGLLLQASDRNHITRLQYEHFSMKDGLSMNPVMAIVPDRAGFIWFGTQDGLNRYDGYRFNVFRHEEADPTTISANFITALYLDRKGNPWIGTLNAGVNKFEVGEERFYRYGDQPGQRNTLVNKSIWAIYESSDGKFWLGCDQGAYILNIDDGTIISPGDLHDNFKVLSGKSTQSFLESRDGTIWVGTEEGLFKLNPGTGAINSYHYEPDNPNSLSAEIVLTLYEDTQDEVWVGTIEGLCLYRPGSDDFKVYTLGVQQSDMISGKTGKRNYSVFDNYGFSSIRHILQDHQGSYWLGTDRGLILFEPDKGVIHRYLHIASEPRSLSDDMIRSLYLDPTGNLWIGSVGAGINKTNLNAPKFEHIEKRINNPYGIRENYVRAMMEDSHGNFWLGMVLGGMNKYNLATGEFSIFHTKGKTNQTKISNNNIWALAEDVDGFIWAGSSFGLNRYDPVSASFSYFNHDPADPTTLSNNDIRCIYSDSRGRLWVGTENGLNIYDEKNTSFSSIFHRPDDPESLSDNYIWNVIEDQDGFIWVATNNGLNKMNGDNFTVTRYVKQPGDTNSLSNNGVRTLFLDKKGRLWIGTQNGLNKYNPEQEGFIRYGERDGLPNAFIYCIREDEYAHLWISTNRGLSRFDPERETFKNYDIYDGVQDYEFNTNSCCINKKGELFFGGPNGLNKFHPDNLQDNLYEPPIVITELRIMDKVIESDRALTEIRELNLKYHQNILFFEFSCLDFTNPARNEYAYMMEGFNDDWIYSGSRRFASYTNLDPGQYVFKIKATNSDGIWSPSIYRINIRITPPFWRTKLFYGACLIAAILGIYLFYKIRTQNLLRAKKLLEKEVAQRTQKLQMQKEEILTQANAIEAKNEQLKEANQEIIQHRDKLAKLSIVASETDNAVVIASASGKIEWMNDACIRIYGFSDEDVRNILGKSIVETSNNPELPEIMQTSIREKKSMIYESISKNYKGEPFWVQSTLTPILDEQQQVEKLVIIDTDITERKEKENIIQQKNKSITDSINYAKRIQEAILPSKHQLGKLFPDAFVLYLPKDIVSGDFFWISEQENKIIVAAADCTGHGVPGAFMSMVGTSLLNETVNEHHITQPAEVLDRLRQGIIAALKQSDVDSATKDGMDIALCAFDRSNHHLEFAGAYNPLYRVRQGTLDETKGDKSPIGIHIRGREIPFTNHTIGLETGDMIYIFSDGYPDQFGGPKNKKFTYKRFKELLTTHSHLPLREQEEVLGATLKEWKGENDQVDDILVIGIRTH